MTELIYKQTREEAAQSLNISTRTLDRYIRQWKISYKKIWNKVMLAENELNNLKDSIWKKIFSYWENIWNENWMILEKDELKIDKKIIENIQVLWSLLIEKENQIKDKNLMIDDLTKKVFYLENKLQDSIPKLQYNQNIEESLELVDKLKWENDKFFTENLFLKKLNNEEKLKNYISILIIILLVAILFTFIWKYF